MLRQASRVFLVAVVVAAASFAPEVFAAEADEAAIRKVHADFAAAWNRHDAAAMAAIWAPDGGLVNPSGRVAKGRGEVQKLFIEEQSGTFKMSTFTHSITGIRMLAPTVAVVEATYEITNATPDGAPTPVTLKGSYMSAMVKNGGKWWTASAMAMAPAAPPGTAPAHH